jgi:hypothetical protein
MGLIKQYSRISHHTLSQANLSTGDPEPFTVPVSEDFTDGSWTPRDLALSEIGVVEDEKRIFIRVDNEIREFLTGPVGGIVPGNSTDVIINLGGEFYADSAFQYDPTGNRQLLAFTEKGYLMVGETIYGPGQFSGVGLGYSLDGAYFQNGYIDPGYVGNLGDNKISGFFAGDLTSLGGVDYSWVAGYRDLDTFEAYNTQGEPGKVTIVARDVAGDGIEINITDVECTVRLEKTGAEFNITSSTGGELLAATDDGLQSDDLALKNFSNDTNAAAGGVLLNGLYHDNGAVRIRLV